MWKIFVYGVLAALGLCSLNLEAHTLRICKVSDSASPVSGTFQFDISDVGIVSATIGQSPTDASPGAFLGCSRAVITVVNATSTVTITELPSPGTELVSISTVPADAVRSLDVPGRSIHAYVGEDGFDVFFYFTNRTVSQVSGNQGCTPGFWKNHTGAWSGFSPAQTVQAVFSSTAGLSSRTLLAALQGGGGSGLAGAQTILLRAGTAALLNAASAQVSYPLDLPGVLAGVNAAIASNNRDTMLTQATLLDGMNNGRGGCPLGGPTAQGGIPQ